MKITLRNSNGSHNQDQDGSCVSPKQLVLKTQVQAVLVRPLLGSMLLLLRYFTLTGHLLPRGINGTSKVMLWGHEGVGIQLVTSFYKNCMEICSSLAGHYRFELNHDLWAIAAVPVPFSPTHVAFLPI